MPLPPGVQPPQPKAKKSKKGAAPAVPPPGFLPNGRPLPVLLITSGPRNGERFMLRNGFLIGKQPGCDLLIEDGYTSSQHAQIGMDANGVCKLYDRQSTNGTYVNGVRVTESALTHGLTIRIGSTEMRFLTE
jgi:pSer/pThr/pTyr-binding forkhead associated (FHA) protein